MCPAHRGPPPATGSLRVGVLLRRFFTWLKSALPVLLDLAGFALLAIGAGLIYEPAGWITAGAALIITAVRIQS